MASTQVWTYRRTMPHVLYCWLYHTVCLAQHTKDMAEQINLLYVPVDGIGEVPVGGDEEEAAPGDVARHLPRLQRLIAMLQEFRYIPGRKRVLHFRKSKYSPLLDSHLTPTSGSSQVFTAFYVLGHP